MRQLRGTVVLACAVALIAPAGSALAAYPSGSAAEQRAWVRRAATNFVTAELAGDGAGACAILDVRLRGVVHHRTCAQRWDAKLAKLLRSREGRGRLRSQRRAIPGARIVIHGEVAWVELSTSLMGGQNRFLWTENCWMLES